jgi:hypothetical protein
MYRKWAPLAGAVATLVIAAVIGSGPNPFGGHGTPIPIPYDPSRPGVGTNPSEGGGFEWGENTLHLGPAATAAEADRTE